MRETFYGKYKGFVRDTNDPEGRGRLRAYCPQVFGFESDSRTKWTSWAEPCFPWFGGLEGIEFGVPYTKEEAREEVGVWIEFEAGNPSYPIWSGCFTIAPTKDGIKSRIDYANASAIPGGSIIPANTGLADLNPPKPKKGMKETAIWVKTGRDIVLGSKDGGCIIIGPHGVQLVGVFVRVNGRVIDADMTNTSM